MRRLKRGQGKYKGKLPLNVLSVVELEILLLSAPMKTKNVKVRKNHNVEKIEASINKKNMQTTSNSRNKRTTYTPKKTSFPLKKRVTT